MASPSKRSSLECLGKKRLITLARALDLDIDQTEPKAALVDAIAQAPASFEQLLERLPIAELTAICTAHELPKGGSKAERLARILAEPPGAAPRPVRVPPPTVPVQPALITTPGSDLPTTASILDALTRERLFDLGRVFGAGLRDARQPKSAVAKALGDALGNDRLLEILPELGRDELRLVCRAHGIRNLDGLARDALIDRLALAAGITTRPAAPPLMSHDGVPRPGQVLDARRLTMTMDAAVLPPTAGPICKSHPIAPRRQPNARPTTPSRTRSSIASTSSTPTAPAKRPTSASARRPANRPRSARSPNPTTARPRYLDGERLWITRPRMN